MAHYQPVRSASPSRVAHASSTTEDDDSDRLLGDGESQPNERLLSGSDDGDEPEKRVPELYAEKRRAWLVGILTILGLVVIVILVLLMRVFLRNRTDGSGNAVGAVNGFRRPSTEYILDESWDFNAPPQVREYTWVIENTVANPDGVFRPMMLINGMFPGEMVRCNEGDTVVVNVENRAVNATAIHWHGLFQNGTNWMDGTPGITQCPIASGGKFRYEFKVQGQSGTYFYHAHQGGQTLDGLVGPFIIHSQDEKAVQQVKYASDRVVMLQDLYYDTSDGLLWDTLSGGNEGSPFPNGALINGKNQVDCSLHPNRECDNTTATLEAFDLAPHENHRLRFLNVGGFAWFEVSVDQHHALPVTEVDGTSVMPTDEKVIVISPGQRYSVVISPNTTSTDAFWLRARMMKHCFGENTVPNLGFDEVKAIIRSTPSPSTSQDELAPPTTGRDSGVYNVICLDMHANKYAPVLASAAPAYAHHSYYLRVNIEIGAWRLERGFLNTSTFRPQLQSPSLHRVMDGLATQNDSFAVEGVNTRVFNDRNEFTIGHKGVETVDIILQNFDENTHPFHLHGHTMFVLAAGHGYFPGYNALGLADEGKGLRDPTNSSIIDNPLRRDVVSVENFGWVLVRFVADNPGLWLFHCHVVWHSEGGMALQFLSRMDLMESWKLPAENARLCDASVEELEKGSPPKDDTWFGVFPDR